MIVRERVGMVLDAGGGRPVDLVMGSVDVRNDNVVWGL